MSKDSSIRYYQKTKKSLMKDIKILLKEKQPKAREWL